MSAVDLPLWVAIPVALLLVIGSSLVLLGALGLVRLRTFYQRLHAPSLITSWGTGSIVLAAMIFYSAIDGKPVLHEILVGVFIMITTPITMLLLGRAALQRDRGEGRTDLPAPLSEDPEAPQSEKPAAAEKPATKAKAPPPSEPPKPEPERRDGGTFKA